MVVSAEVAPDVVGTFPPVVSASVVRTGVVVAVAVVVVVVMCRVGLSAEVDRVSGRAGTGARGLEDTSRA